VFYVIEKRINNFQKEKFAKFLTKINNKIVNNSLKSIELTKK